MPAVGLKQEQGARLVGGIVGDGNGVAVGDLFEGRLGSGINAEGLIMDPAGNAEVGAVVGVEVLQVVDVLEIIGVDLAAVDDIVGLDIILKLDDLKFVALCCQDRLYLRQDLRVGCGARGDSNVIVFRGLCFCFGCLCFGLCFCGFRCGCLCFGLCHN